MHNVTLDPSKAQSTTGLRPMSCRLLLRAVVLVAVAAVAGCGTSSVAANRVTHPSDGPGLPVLQRSGVPKPAGAAGGVRVLDWAGFKAAVSYTFDDGLASQATNYPQLQASGVRMTFFLNGDAGNAATWRQAAQNGHELANHTAHHCRHDGTYCRGWAGSMEVEYDLCSEYLRQTYGVSTVWTTASPYGDMGYDEVSKTRFFLNRGVRSGQVAPNDGSDASNLPAYAAAGGDTAGTLNPHIDTARSAGNWQIFLLHSLGGDGGYAPVNTSEVIASIDHAKSAGDIWLDSMVNIGAYWAGQKAVTNAVSTRSGKDTILTWTLPEHFPPGRYVRVTTSGGTLKQRGKKLRWNDAGYYEVALDAGSLTISPR